MTEANDPEHLARLVRELRHLPSETQWVEFKDRAAGAHRVRAQRER